MHKYSFYLSIGICSFAFLNCHAMQHKWTKTKGSYTKAQIHKRNSPPNPSKTKNVKGEKLARLRAQHRPITPQDQLTALVGIIVLNEATQHRRMPIKK